MKKLAALLLALLLALSASACTFTTIRDHNIAGTDEDGNQVSGITIRNDTFLMTPEVTRNTFNTTFGMHSVPRIPAFEEMTISGNTVSQCYVTDRLLLAMTQGQAPRSVKQIKVALKDESGNASEVDWDNWHGYCSTLMYFLDPTLTEEDAEKIWEQIGMYEETVNIGEPKSYIHHNIRYTFQADFYYWDFRITPGTVPMEEDRKFLPDESQS